jgi:hypothetical protein
LLVTSSNEVSALFFSDDFQQLCLRTERFAPFRVMGVSHREVVHSNILAALLNPGGNHGLGSRFLEQFLYRLGRLQPVHGYAPTLATSLACANDHPRVYRESDRLDILLEFPNARVSICIENKIRAGEQDSQISRYQQLLLRRYPGTDWERLVVFLTPDGRPPSSAHDLSGTCVLRASYNDVLGLVEDIRAFATGDTATFLAQFCQHLKEDVVQDPELSNLCFQILRRHADAVAILMKNVPTLDVVFEHLTADAREWDPSLEVTRWPARGPVTQIFARRDLWPQEVYVIVFLVPTAQPLDPRPRLAAAMAEWTAKRWREALNDTFSTIPRMIEPGWTWLSITDAEPETIDVGEAPLGRRTAEEVSRRLRAIVERVHDPLVRMAASATGKDTT